MIALMCLACCSELFAQYHVTLSRVGERETQAYVIECKSENTYEILGEQKSAFTINKDASGNYEVRLAPNQKKGLYSATLEVRKPEGKDIYNLHGLAIEKFEGKNEPSLYKIFKALGVKADLGGDRHTYSTEDENVGDSQRVETFRLAKGVKEMSITLIARYSPVGAPEIGFAMDDGESFRKIGVFSDISEAVPDAHQRLFPSEKSGEASFAAKPNFIIPAEMCAETFGFYYKGKNYTSSTYAGKSKGATITHTARIFKIENFLGRELKNAYMICYEEAKNGDYQDAIVLVEGIEPE